MLELRPMSEMHGITDEKTAREYISALARNVADQSAMSAMIAVEWGIDSSYISALLLMENERAQKDMIVDTVKYLASRLATYANDTESNDTEDKENG